MRVLPLIVAAAVLVSSAALAAPQPSVSSDTPWLGVRAAAMRNMTQLTCGSTPCAAATPDEMANPPVSDAEARDIYLRGFYSGAAEHCGLDWQSRNFVPMMAWWRHTANKSTRQLALIGAIHGIAQGMAKTALDRTGACTTDLKGDLDRRLDFRPPAANG